ncbi:polysaccharide ABC transporter ATP-binding protein [Vibrio cionasavignyae]|uniref:ABC transporter ATP-binding protein n=1 Tax=Vibrio cionasavignyae TaxID=2910252 RepID=UPI003D149E4E
MTNNDDAVIKIEGVSKRYRLGEVGTGTISHDLNRLWCKLVGKEDPYLKVGEVNDRTKKGTSDYVQVLNGIDLEVKKGEILGIIGKNGAGKSTLLKVLSKVTGPTEGTIKTKGRIASLLEVGTGFHPELTGRENIYMNGTLMGMSRKEITCKLEEIVEFAGIERYLDTPVKRYSSGMTVRLGFAIAAHLEPEILIVDEVLAVGDAEFQKKAIGKMQDVSESQGRTVLFVSHNMAAMKKMCTKAILLEQGQIVAEGKVDDVIDRYLANQVCQLGKNKQVVKSSKYIRDISYLLDGNELDNYSLKADDTLEILGKFYVDEIPDRFELRILIKNKAGEVVAALSSGLMNGVYFKKTIDDEFHVSIDISGLTLGVYSIDIDVYIPWVETYEILENICSFEVASHDINNTGFSYSTVWDPKLFLKSTWTKND